MAKTYAESICGAKNEETGMVCEQLPGHEGLHRGIYGPWAQRLPPLEPQPGGALRVGLYRKREGHTGVGHLYQLLGVARHHTTGQHFVIYIPLRLEPEWAGTIRQCVLEREAFERKFEFAGEALPADPADFVL